MAKPVRTNLSRLTAQVDELIEYRLDCGSPDCWESLSSEVIEGIGCQQDLALKADEKGWQFVVGQGVRCPDCLPKKSKGKKGSK